MAKEKSTKTPAPKGVKVKGIVKDVSKAVKPKNWIANAIKKPGALHKEMGVAAGKKIPKSKIVKAAKKPGKLGKRANLALTLESFKK